MNPLRRFALWVFKNEWIPLGPLPPHVLLGWALGSKGQRVSAVEERLRQEIAQLEAEILDCPCESWHAPHLPGTPAP